VRKDNKGSAMPENLPISETKAPQGLPWYVWLLAPLLPLAVLLVVILALLSIPLSYCTPIVTPIYLTLRALPISASGWRNGERNTLNLAFSVGYADALCVIAATSEFPNGRRFGGWLKNASNVAIAILKLSAAATDRLFLHRLQPILPRRHVPPLQQARMPALLISPGVSRPLMRQLIWSA
jgi:hypothetical protein